MALKLELACGFQRAVGDLWTEDHLRDFTVVVEDKTFHCHRFILFACSGIFQKVLKSQPWILAAHSVDGMTASTFDVILKALYTGINGLTVDNFLDVWSATVKLQIGYLTLECENFACDNMNVNNCFQILDHAVAFSAESVINRFFSHIALFFEDFINSENLLQLSFDHFYRIIEDYSLNVKSEDQVLETIIKWVEHTSSKITVKLESVVALPGGSQKVSDETTLERLDRKQHLCKLVSACRLFLVSYTYLEDLLRNNKLLMSSREAYDLVFEALMYNLHLDRRQNPWPDAAVHRLHSSMNHVMVFYSNRKFIAYKLKYGSVYEFANLPEDFVMHKTINVFDNKLCLEYVTTSCTTKLSMHVEEKTWTNVTVRKTYDITQRILLAHGCHIYCLSNAAFNSGVSKKLCSGFLQRCHCMVDSSRDWSFCCEVNKHADVLVRFQQYVLIFCTENSIITAQCYNTETEKTHTFTTLIDGTSQDMTSFSHQGDVFLLQRNGSLWKIVSSDRQPVDFERISKLWDQDYILRGCVVYRKELYVFRHEYQQGYTAKASCSTLRGFLYHFQEFSIMFN